MDVHEVLMCLNSAVYCLTHDVDKGTKAFAVEHLKELITKLEEEA